MVSAFKSSDPLSTVDHVLGYNFTDKCFLISIFSFIGRLCRFTLYVLPQASNFMLYSITYRTPLYTVYCILYNVYCILYNVYCILYTVYCILYTAQLLLFRLQVYRKSTQTVQTVTVLWKERSTVYHVYRLPLDLTTCI